MDVARAVGAERMAEFRHYRCAAGGDAVAGVEAGTVAGGVRLPARGCGAGGGVAETVSDRRARRLTKTSQAETEDAEEHTRRRGKPRLYRNQSSLRAFRNRWLSRHSARCAGIHASCFTARAEVQAYPAHNR